jgi:hypothetical protein
MALELRSLGSLMDEQTLIELFRKGALPEYEDSVKVLLSAKRCLRMKSTFWKQRRCVKSGTRLREPSMEGAVEGSKP